MSLRGLCLINPRLGLKGCFLMRTAVNPMHKWVRFFGVMSLLASHTAGCGVKVATNDDSQTNDRQVVGRCHYDDYPGTVTIKEVRAPAQVGGEEVVTVEFDPDGGESAPSPVQHFRREMSLPREKAEKRGLAVGQKFRATASYSAEGPCQPGPYLFTHDRVLLEVEVKKRLEATRDELGLSSLSATIIYLIDNLPDDKRKPQTGPTTAGGKGQVTYN